MDNKNKTAYLDYLRGAATLFVILLHAITPHLSAANFTETRSFILMAVHGNGGAVAQVLSGSRGRDRAVAGADGKRGSYGAAGQREILEEGKMFHDVSVFLILAESIGE